MSDYRDKIRQQREAALLRQQERARANAQQNLNLPELPTEPTERAAELERRHLQARAREPQTPAQIAADLRKARQEREAAILRQTMLDELYPPQRCHLCGKDSPFGFGPPGWTKPFWACLLHRPPFIPIAKQPGEKTGAQLMAELMQRP